MASKPGKRALSVKDRKQSNRTQFVSSKQLKSCEAINEPDRGPSHSQWLNRQRVLVLGSRGISADVRHLLRDLGTLMVHSRRDCKLDRRDSLSTLADICELHHCTKVLFVESRGTRAGRQRTDSFLWLSSYPHGPSVKFHLSNLHTMQHLHLTGNCMRGSRALLALDAALEHPPHDAVGATHWQLIRELLVHVLGIPREHPLSQPHVDHVLNVGLLDRRLWFRNYQIVDESTCELAEIGPRFTLLPVRILSGCFRGATLYENPNFVSLNTIRRAMNRKKRAAEWEQRVSQRAQLTHREHAIASRPLTGHSSTLDPTDAVFDTD